MEEKIDLILKYIVLVEAYKIEYNKYETDYYESVRHNTEPPEAQERNVLLLSAESRKPWQNSGGRDITVLSKYHDCKEEGCTDTQHYGVDKGGLCLVCGGCSDPECCQHDSDCYPPYE